MSKIGLIGLGKLGLPVALAWASKGYDVFGYDVSDSPSEIMRTRKYPHLEPGAQSLLDAGVDVKVLSSAKDVVLTSDIVFVAVQTPHGPSYEGITRMPETRADFDYTMLKDAVAAVAHVSEAHKKQTTMVVISTCLPGTCDREVVPLLNEHVSLVYSPLFIAQSTVVEDALNPEFVLLGVDKADEHAIEIVGDFFRSMHAPEKLRFMSVASAEATKVAYNVFLGLKIVAINSWMEICHKVGANVDDVSDALAMATDRVTSAKYMRGGMGDGGGCHPRDQIALSWLARQLNLSYDLAGAMVVARENQTQWLADLAFNEAMESGLPVVILGKAYKRGTNLTIGSPAVLLKNIFDEYAMPGLKVEQWDPFVDRPCVDTWTSPCVFVVAADHDEFYDPHHFRYPAGSVIIDPWGKMPDQDGVKVIRVGRIK